jgi:signal transduction histidine kinase/CHASE3 domain sensor protein
LSRILVARANTAALAAIVLLMAMLAAVTWRQHAGTQAAREWVRHTYQVLGTLKDLGIAVRDAETGQRGFLLTGDESYLKPNRGASARITLLHGELRQLTADNSVQQDRLRMLAPLIQRKLDELSQTIQARRDLGLEAAQRMVQSGLGQDLMVQIEAAMSAMSGEEQRLLGDRLAEVDRSEFTSLVLTVGGSLVALGLLVLAARLLSVARARLLQSEAEQRDLVTQLRSSLDSISQGIGVFDAGRHLVRWNRCLPILLELPPALLRPGTPYASLALQLAEAMPSGSPFLETEDQLRHRRTGWVDGKPVVYERTRASDGRTFEVRRTGMPDGGFVLTISDLTERSRAEAMVRASQRMDAVGQLTGGLAHDFNNLLSIVMGNLELTLNRLDKTNALRTRLERAMWAVQRGADLTRQLLAFARRQPLAPQPIDLSAMLPELTTLLRRTLGEHIEVRVIDTAGLWLALTDPVQVESAILNLALNARDAMPYGGRLTIELANKVLDDSYARQHSELHPGDYVMIAVSDTGTGMPPEIQARVFEPFFSTKEAGKGTGLGLSMVFGFAKQSGGHVNIYSEVGQGTTVRLYLPRAVGAVVAAPYRVGTPIELPRGSATLLIVEDDADVREVAAAMLRELGYRVLTAADGPEALRVFGENDAAVDLALIDVVLPAGMKGNQLAQRLREVRPGLRVLFMSGYTENAIVHHGRLDDGVPLIGKPFQRERLAIKVAEVLGGVETAGAPLSRSQAT